LTRPRPSTQPENRVFRIRHAIQSDVGILLKLAKMVHFINLPADKEAIAEKIRRSRASFTVRGETPPVDANGAYTGPAGHSPQYMFVVEDARSGSPIGTSALIAQMGSPGNPNVALTLRKREFFSKDLQTGATHVTAQLLLEEDGPSEIGGLIVGPTFRGHGVGKMLSLVRFHYIGLHRKRFKDRLLAEMMAPITPDGRNLFWDHFGRKFINLSYVEADTFCMRSREFMTSLLPREEIYLTLLPPEARAVIGQVGADTLPARRMLERLGFVYRDRIDPFDGGPNLEAKTDDIPLIRDTRRVDFAGAAPEGKAKGNAIVSHEDPANSERPFLAVMTPYTEASGGKSIKLPKQAIELLGVQPGARLGFTPLDSYGAIAPKAAAKSAASNNGAAAKPGKGATKKQASKPAKGGKKAKPAKRKAKA